MGKNRGRKLRKRIGSLLLGAMLLFGSVPMDVSAAAAEQYTDAGSYAEQGEAESIFEEDFDKESGMETITPEELEKRGNEGTKVPERLEENGGGGTKTPEDSDETEPLDSISGNNLVMDTVSGEDPVKEQYHLVEDDPESVAKWLSLYCPNGFADLRMQSESWWNNLYDDERDYAEFLLGLILELPEDIYVGQDLEECIRILESGRDADAFFEGTVFEGMTLEDLKALYAEGSTLEDLLESGSAPAGRSRKAPAARESGEEVVEEWVAIARVISSGYRGESNVRVFDMWLGGVRALCIDCGLDCKSGFLYHADPGKYQVKTGHLGYFAQKAGGPQVDYVASQIAAWLFIEDENMSEAQVKSRAQAIVNLSSKVSMSTILPLVWKFYTEAKSYVGTYYEYYSDHTYSQRLITATEAAAERRVVKKPEGPVNPDAPSREAAAEYTLNIDKKDWQTGVGLAGCEVEILENGEYLASVITDENGHASYKVEKSATFYAEEEGMTKEEAEASLEKKAAEFMATPYTYSVSEALAPGGYVWALNEKSETITGGKTANFVLTDERTLGAVELIKYDVERETGEAQGDASLDGAVYGIYAAADIYHQDKKTGRLFEKDALVQTAVIGKTPKRDGNGYLLNADGSRHIANPGGEIGYVETPGRTLFGDLELGSYYIREITPSEGYLLDEAVYPATFTYRDQTVKIECREETAGQADNELTADDDIAAETVYSGDYVIKQGIRLLKTSDNDWQTDLNPIAGAGFSVYLISNLTGVKNGQISPIGETWTADDIMTFYDYDFTEEKTASVYKRTGHETWTTGDRLWLKAGSGQNEYYVDEMFTDADGYLETPELPYGTYVVVETTTPADHTCAKPFIVSVTEDGGVLYTDERKQSIEKTYQKEEGIRYGDHKKTKEREGRAPQRQRIVNNRITRTHLRILKVDEEFKAAPGTYIKAEEFVRGTVLKEGVTYRLRCTTLPYSRDGLLSLNWKFDKDGYLSFYDQEIRELTGTKERPFAVKFLRKGGVIQDCYIMLPQEIPVGTYELEELTAPAGYVLNGKEQFVADASSERVNRYEILDMPFPKLTFTIDNGAVYPDGQMGTNKYALTDEYGNLTVTVLQENQEQKGVLEITKHGEQLAGAQESGKTLLDKLEGEPFRAIKNAPEKDSRDLVFIYEDAPVEGAVFQVIAAEDIYTQEVDKDLFDSYQIKKEQYLVHKKGDVAATITTDRNGYGYAADLYIGKYKLVETVAGDGFVLNKKETEFEITGHEQTVNFDFHAADYKNERQKLEIRVKKQDQETKEALQGAVYGLYAGEDILIGIEKGAENGRWIIKDSPEILYPADTLVATCITDEAGTGVFDADLPLGKYYVRELEAPLGYLTASEDFWINGGYDSRKGGQNAEKQAHEKVLENRETTAFIAKRDLVSGAELAGATLEIQEILTDGAGNPKKDAAGNDMTKPVISWVSQGEEAGHQITGLALEKPYILSEQAAPDGYGYAEDILFKLVQRSEDGKLVPEADVYVMEEGSWKKAEDDVLAMYDEKEALKIEKSTIRMTQRGDTYRYTVEALKNLTGEELEDFTMTDHLPAGLYLTKLWTGTYNENLLYDAEYMTNKSGEWIPWEKGLSTEENHCLQIPENLQTKEEHVTKFRLLFGTVGGDFEKKESPMYMTYVSQEAGEVLINEIELTAEHNGKKLRDKDETKTVLYLRKISGYGAGGGGNPLYEIVEIPMEETPQKRIVRRTTQQEAEKEAQRLEDEEVPLGLFRTVGAQTGDKVPVRFLAQAAVLSFAGAVILACFWRRKGRRKVGTAKESRKN